VFVVPESATDEQLHCLGQIFTGQLGGLPWSILGTTYAVTGVGAQRRADRRSRD
jgi:hypothetical protein